MNLKKLRSWKGINKNNIISKINFLKERLIITRV